MNLNAQSMAAALSTSTSHDDKPVSALTHVSFTLLAFILSTLLFIFSRVRRSKSLNLPPGPPGWPVVGNLLQFARSGKLFIHYVRDLRPIYGPIFTIRMGARTLVVISSNELAHEALIEKGQVFASRPMENPTRNVFSSNKFTVNSAVYGPVWRSLRRNMVSGMLSNTRLREFSKVRDLAMDRFIERLRAEAKSNNDCVWVLKNARFAVFCILLSMCFGVDMDQETIDNVDRVLKRVLMAVTPRLDDYLPLLSPFFGKQRKEAREAREEQIRTLVPLINQRRSEIINSKQSQSFAYLDSLFDLKIEGRKSSPTNDELVTLCSELINGGTDTTATAIEWAIARLIEKPSIQTKLYDEIKSTVGDRKVSESDTEKMVYLNAFIKELLRKHPPTHMSLTHATVELTTLAGYDIPPDVNVDFYLPPISENARLWSDPAEFRPERFLMGEDADMTGVKNVKMMPFGIGRRICPGLGMAMVHINLMVAKMVQEFEWLGHPSQLPIDFTENVEFTTVMKNTLLAVVKPRATITP